MKRDFLINSASYVGKIAIGETNLHPIAKASINFGIDVAAECLKNELSPYNEKICNIAKHFDIDKVVAIPLGTLNGENIIAIRAFGNKAEAFINHLGLQFILENGNNNFANNVLENEKNFGVVIYEKKN